MFVLCPQYDGERAQIHLLADGRIMIYSRNSEDHTGKYPDVIRNLPHAFNTFVGQKSDAAATTAATIVEVTEGEETKEESKEAETATAAAASSSAAAAATAVVPAADAGDVGASPLLKSFIIDAEVVAWDRVQRKILPFQTLSTRKKKDVDTAGITVQVCLFAFDLLFLNGKVSNEKKSEQARGLGSCTIERASGLISFFLASMCCCCGVRSLFSPTSMSPS